MNLSSVTARPAAFTGVRRAAARPQAVRSVRVLAGTIADEANNAGCGQLVAALSQVGLGDVASGSGTHTIFAPTDAAFSAANLAGQDLKEVLLFHVAKGAIQGRHVENYPTIPTMSSISPKVAVDIRAVKGSILVGQPAQGMQGLAGTPQGGFISQSINCDNGVIHVIDGVMIPLPPLVGQNGGYVAGTEAGSGEGRTGLDTKVHVGGTPAPASSSSWDTPSYTPEPVAQPSSSSWDTPSTYTPEPVADKSNDDAWNSW